MRNILRPLDLKVQPVQFQERHKVLEKLYKQLERCKKKATKDSLIKLSTNLEASVAKRSSSSQSYKFNMSVVLRDLLKYKGDLSKITIAGKLLRPTKKVEGATKSKDDVMKALRSLLVDVDLLKKHGYIMSEQETTDENSEPIYRVCARCNTKFEQDKILEKTLCTYHPMKKQYNRETKMYVYPCCGETTSSTSFLRLGCKNFEYHVFKGEKYCDLRKISEFLTTEKFEGNENVLSLDCEMAFTTMGFEMIRLTIIDFFTSQIIFNEIIKPMGKVIDLNSDFSGVHVIPGDSLTFNGTMEKILRPDLINKNSILIGHGFENDLNVMRIIHNRIIDTAILYSNGRLKMSLKNLTFEVLSEKIQTGEHDSTEDALATMNIIKKKLGISLDQIKWDGIEQK
ncbi:hypothetical protein KAFR_0B02940 [Kazachstania africana CBS 2517]|uniref:RNA exonuclease 3 n=1 Tax=Kazachstania africana (strain ATCC 22294 / BCRC 22015 / CBS 2517 / CECT 1963 / NBRC 1671 / NRRL Y-8276) TaxID=1071382 RepID=H2AQE0_KAZAF|nr:hypothetical protein KAFR_0B02940 [Kazachstania africana CBS 2517]CCF56590.1 hypothetical protein KAFR_0B02940 [Kazachstania africana CBS 2517]